MRRPRRIQLSRSKGWRLPDGAVSVARPTRWGNPFEVRAVGLSFHGPIRGDVAHYGNHASWAELEIDGEGLTAAQAVSLYRRCLEDALLIEPEDHPDDKARAQEITDALTHLRGHDLACWCPLDQPCHADVLLEMANQGVQ